MMFDMSPPVTSTLHSVGPSQDAAKASYIHYPASQSSSSTSGSGSSRPHQHRRAALETRENNFLYPAHQFARHPLLSKTSPPTSSALSPRLGRGRQHPGLASPSVRPVLSLEEPKGIMDLGEEIEFGLDMPSIGGSGSTAAHSQFSHPLAR